jgi:hypothetical protein
MRFFRCLAGDLAYDEARLALDAAWGHPSPDGKTVTCIDPAEVAPRDKSGTIVLAVRDEFCDYPAAAALLSQLIASGAVEEITEAEYQAAVSVPLQG